MNIAHAHRHNHVTCELYIHLDWHASVGNTGRRSITDTVPAYVGDAAAVDLCQQGVVQRNAMLGRREAKKIPGVGTHARDKFVETKTISSTS